MKRYGCKFERLEKYRISFNLAGKKDVFEATAETVVLPKLRKYVRK